MSSILLVLAHPDPSSLNHALAATVQDALRERGHTIWFHDLYAEGLDPVLPAGEVARDAMLDDAIARHCDELASAEGIVIVHPNWWGQPPAILKGWIDRVVRPGVAYRFLEGDAGDGVPLGLLRARAALILNTSNTPRERELAAFGDPLDTLWRNCVLGLCGVERVERRMFGVVVTSTPDQRRAWLTEARALAVQLFDDGH